MKTKIHLAIFTLLQFSIASAQITNLTLRPGAADGKDALIWKAVGFNHENTNFGNTDVLPAYAWTSGGLPDSARALLSFNLSGIPSCATIISATLSLSNNPSTAFAGGAHSTLSGSNACYLRKITSSWDEQTVTWNTSPSYTVNNQVSIPASINNHQNYPSIDVTSMVQDMVLNPAGNFGFLLTLQNESYYRKMIFGSSDCADSTLRPSLTISYMVNENSLTLQPGPNDGKDALIWKVGGFNYENMNFGNVDALPAYAWTSGGLPDSTRALMNFDLSALPADAVLINATLSLYNNPTTAFASGAHSTLSGSNACYVRRITSSWNEQNVTWNTQPSFTTSNQVSIPASTDDHQNYPAINITQLVQDMKADPAHSFGLLLILQDETYYRKMVFGSSDCADAGLRPKLRIVYQSSSHIIGSAGFCRSSTNNIYSVSPVQSGVTYNWTFPPGATIVSGQGTSSVNVSYSSTAVAGTISVLASNGCGNASASKAIVLRSSNPSTPGTITGSNVGCHNDSKLFTIKKISNADYYIWIPPAGATINGSSAAFTTPDTGVVVVYGPSFTGDTLRVKSGNCRGISAERKLRINKTNPSTPGTISGLNVGLCNLSGSIYSINAVNNATSYTWRTNIAGATINGNVSPVTTTTTSATINFGTFTTGQIYVKANNGCGSSAERSLTVNAKPAVPSSITGPTAICTNQSGINYSTVAVNNASSYNWTVPSGCTINSGQGTTVMIMTARSTPASGTVRVRSQNSCASSAYLSKSVTISTCPRLENGELIIDKIYTDVYPNPASDVFHIAIISNEESSARIILKDINGRTVKTITKQIHYGDNFYDMDVTGFADGVYILSITASSGFSENHKMTIR